MTQEAKRCQHGARAGARQGKPSASSAPATAASTAWPRWSIELRGETQEPEVEAVPGLTAACSGGALLGAPLTHDFAVVSLSDRLDAMGDDRKAAAVRR